MFTCVSLEMRQSGEEGSGWGHTDGSGSDGVWRDHLDGVWSWRDLSSWKAEGDIKDAAGMRKFPVRRPQVLLQQC